MTLAELGSLRAEAIDSPLNLVGIQAKYLRETLEVLNLQGVTVLDQPVYRDASFFKNSLMLAITSFDEIPLVIAVAADSSSGDQSPKSHVVVVAPIEEGSGFLVDEKTGSVWTDSFWICENNQLKCIKPSQPIRLDSVNVMFDQYARDSAALSQEFDKNKRLHDLTDDKQLTRDVLAKRGIKIPSGVVIGPNQDVQEAVDAFIAANPKAKGYVVKEFHGAHGDGVVMFGKKEKEQMLSYIWEGVHDFGHPLILEERIVPVLPSSARERFSLLGRNIDYNFRILVSLDREDPQVFDGEIRFKQKNNNPVNITAVTEKASASEIDNPTVLSDFGEDLIENIFETARAATKAVCEEALLDGEKVAGFAGVDLITDSKGQVYVMEVNAGSGVGGYGTITRVKGQIPDSIVRLLIPDWIKSITPRQEEGLVDLARLKRLPHTVGDASNLMYMYLYDKQQIKAAGIMDNLLEIMFDRNTAESLREDIKKVLSSISLRIVRK